MSAPQDAPAPSAPEPEGTPAPEAPADTGGLDRLYARMDQMASQQQTFMDSVTQQLAPPEEPEEDESLYYSDEGELTEQGAAALIRSLVDERVQEQLAPREAARLLEQRDDAFEALREQHPDLQDEKTANEVLAKAIRWANQMDPSIIDRPQFVDVIEAFYKADKYEEFAKTQAAEQPRAVVLESGRGAARTQQLPNEPDWGERIVKAAERLHPKI